MLWFLLIATLLLAFIILKITKDYFSPSFLLCVIFSISCIFSIIGNISWNSYVSFMPITIIVISLLFITFGEFFVRFVIFKGGFKVNKISFISMKTIKVNVVIIFLLIIAQIIFTVFYYKRMIDMATKVGYSGQNYFMYARNSNESAGFIYNLLITSFEPFALICMYIFINNFIVDMKSTTFFKNSFLFIPSILYCLTTILTGARVGIVEYVIIFALMILYFIRKINFKESKIKYRYLIIPSIIVMFTFVVVFLKIGESRNGIRDYSNFEYINIYAGSSIVAFSEWFPNRIVGGSNTFGSFIGIVNTFSRISSSYESTFYEFVSFNNGTTTNVYTGFRSYIEDFGIVGLFLISFVIGVFMTILYKKLLNNESIFYNVLYMYFLKQFLYLFLAASITSNLLSPTQILFLIWLILLSFLIKITSSFKENKYSSLMMEV